MVLILYRNVKSNLHNAPKCLQVSQIQNVNKSLPGKRVYTKDFYKKMSSFIKEFECTQFHTREVFVGSVSPVYNLSMDTKQWHKENVSILTSKQNINFGPFDQRGGHYPSVNEKKSITSLTLF